MTAVKSLRVQRFLRVAPGGALLLVITSPAWAQTQNLTIAFQQQGAGVSAVSLPLSNWLSVGIALLVSLTAFVVLRRRNIRGGRFLGAMVVMIAGATMLGIVGQRLISEARASGPVTLIDLSTSPATLDILPFAPNFLTAEVVNTSGNTVQITSITLAPGPYLITTPTTCATSLILAPSAECSISLGVPD